MLDELRKLSREFLEIKKSPYRRYFIQNTPLTHRLSILVGPRGVGKTTTLIQSLLDAAENDPLDPKILYIQSDHFSLGSTALYEIAEQFRAHGGKWIVFDEIHKYPHWSKELKSIYDTFPDLQILASGSSALEIHRGSHDLSRRAIVYSMQGMSFREHLELTHSFHLPSFPFQTICKEHESLAKSIVDILREKDIHVLAEFHRYLQIGYYPYFHELKEESLYKITLEQNVHTTIESDLIAIYPQLSGASIQKIKRLLRFIASAVPFIPNWNHIMTLIDVGDLRTLKSYFSHLEDAGLIRSIGKASKKFNALESPCKIYLENSNLLYAIAQETPEVGTVRETFFLSMVSQKYDVRLPNNGDFLIDETYLIEVGGKNKNSEQIRGHQQNYLACDGIERGVGNKIPLWLFGFLY